MKKIINKDFFNPYLLLLDEIKKKGGFVNAHAHIDRAYTLTKNNFCLTNANLQEKWQLVDEIKERATVDEIYDRMALAIEEMIKQGSQALGTFIDIDPIIKDKAIKAAYKIRERYKKAIKIKFINQVLKGVIDKEARRWFEYGADFVDIIGGLPGKDKGKEAEHLEIILDTGKRLKKMVHVHVDQLNTQKEKETELLAQKTLEGKMKRRVVAVHGVSIAAQKKSYREKLYQLIKKAGLMLVVCPSAWIDSRRTEELAPTHNAIAPVEEMIPLGITIALGTDNIFDIYKPFSDGNLLVELRFLLETCHFYEIDKLVEIATINGLKVLGL